MTPFQVLLSAFAISSFAGLAALLRSKAQITTRAVLSATMYSGAMGLIIGMLMYEEYGAKGNYLLLIGFAGLAGIGGVTVIDLAIIAAKKSGIRLVLQQPKDEPEEKDP